MYAIVKDSQGKEYKQVNDTCYDTRTPDDLIKILEELRLRRVRVHFCLGNTETGEDWQEEFMVTGRIGRSTGTCKIPLVIYNERSYGGPALMDDCIVAIFTTKGKYPYYKHPLYHVNPENGTDYRKWYKDIK